MLNLSNVKNRELSVTTINPTCVDYNIPGRLSDCPSRAYLCNDTIYYTIMTKLCPRTCNRCPGEASTIQPPVPSKSRFRFQNLKKFHCSDRVGANGQSNCASVAHLCQNFLYINVMKEQCARTCKFC
uniref:ShTK domain protein n=1 Tax=Elaeophora elaphi TaxID=1147741 RepID=A0A0R3RP81_9BILA